MVASLWRLGPVLEEPAPDAVALGGPGDAGELIARVRERRLAGAVILAGGPGEEGGGLPARRAVRGVATFRGAGAVDGEHVLLGGGPAAVRSSLGVHAVREGGVLVAGAGPGRWGDLAAWWLLPALAEFLSEILDRPLVALPPLGCLRLDDAPGTAELQLLGRARPDERERRRLRAMVRALESSGSTLVAAVAARALRDGAIVPIDEVWPASIALIAESVERGLMEPACHGLLHLDPAEHAAGRVAPREFLRLDREEAGRRLDEALAWMRGRLGPARSFIAPAWGYSDGALAAAAERGLTTWMPPRPGPLAEGHLLRETLHDGVPGLTGVRYAPLVRLAEAGIPPTVVFHGRLLDDRLPRLRAARDVVALARLARRRDLERIAALRGVRWVGAAELAERLRAHAAAPPDDAGTEAVLLDARPGRPRSAPAGGGHGRSAARPAP